MMTQQQDAVLSQEEKRVKIAEACGWRGVYENLSLRGQFLGHKGDSPQESGWKCVPDYLHDLNAMHAVWLEWKDRKINKADPQDPDVLLRDLSFALEYEESLRQVCGAYSYKGRGINTILTTHATATERAEGFGMALNLW